MNRPTTVELLPLLLMRGNTLPTSTLEGFRCTGAEAVFESLVQCERDLEKTRVDWRDEIHRVLPLLSGKSRSLGLDFKRWLARSLLPVPEKWFGIVSEMGEKSLSFSRSWNDGILGLSTAHVRFEKAFSEDVLAARGKLAAILKDDWIREGIFLSSGELDAAVFRLLSATAERKFSEKTQRQIERSVTAHLTRAVYKATPRGLLSGLGVAEWSRSVDGTDEQGNRTSRRTLLSLPIARRIARLISENEEVRKRIVPRTNGTLFENDEAYFFQFARDEQESLYSLPAKGALRTFVELANRRVLNASELVQEAMKMLPGHDDAALSAFYRRLCDTGVLIGTLEIPYERRDALAFLLEWIEASFQSDSIPADVRKIRDFLSEAKGFFKLLDAGAGGFDEKRRIYEEFQAALDRILPGSGVAPVRVRTVVECRIQAAVALDPSIGEHLKSAVEVCSTLVFARGRVVDPYLRAWRMLLQTGLVDSTTRDRDIPLAKLLRGDLRADEASLAEDRNPQSEEFLRRFSALLDEAPVGASLGLTLESVRARFGDLISKSGTQTIGESAVEFQLGSSGGGPDVKPLIVLGELQAALIPSFARYEEFLSSSRYSGQLDEHARWLDSHVYPAAARFDVLTHHCGIIDTAIIHGCHQPYRIELFETRSEGDLEKIIPIREIFIRIAEPGHFTLVWKRKGGESPVHPSYCSFRNRKDSPAIFSFLAVLGYGIGASLGGWFDPALNSRARIPRLTTGQVVLRRESWTFARDELRTIAGNAPSRSYLEWRRWRERHGVPKLVFAQVEAKPFFVDFENPFCLDQFAAALLKSGTASVRIVEMLPEPGDRAAGSLAGREGFTTQFLAGVRWKSR